MDFSLICQTLEIMQLPYIITDLNFDIIWTNSYFKNNYDYLNSFSSLNDILVDYETEKIADLIQSTKQPITLDSILPMASFTITISPLNDGNNLSGFLASITEKPLIARNNDYILDVFNKNLRKPIESIKNIIQFIRYGDYSMDMAHSQQIEVLVKKCYQALRSCCSILEYTEFVNGSAKLNKEFRNFSDFLENQLTPAIPILKRDNIKLNYSIEKDIYFNFDAEQFSIVLFSLISNCCLFCDRKNSINITLCREENFAVLTVSDSGYGISKEHLPYVFEPYYSFGLDDDDKPGLGLGLPIVKAITNLHNGDIKIESKQDCGTSVTLSFPISTSRIKTLRSRRLAFENNNSYNNMLIYLSNSLPPHLLY